MSGNIIIAILFGSLIWSSLGAHKGQNILKKEAHIQKRAAGRLKSTVPPLVNPQSWNLKVCPKVNTLFNKKSRVVSRMENTILKIENKEDLSESEKTFQISTLNILCKELNATEKFILQSINWMDVVLKGDFKEIINMKENSKSRLEALRDATLKEEQEYNEVLKAEEQLKQYNKTQVVGLINEILRDVAAAADQLQDQLDEHLFDKALHDPNLANGANIEAVIRVEGGKEEKTGNNKSSKADQNSVIKLLDAQDNQFVLSKGKDSTIPHEDHHLIQDVVSVVLVSYVCGWVCSVLGLPTMFGYVVSGVILGPSGINHLKSLVQLETVGEFGVFFILFCVGLEFSPAQLKKVLKIACVGTTLMMTLMVLSGIGLGYLWHASFNESVFVAACLSLSSTPLVVKFLNPASSDKNTNSPSNTDYGAVLLGILIMQDVLLGLLMAILPNMAPSDQPATDTETRLELYMRVGVKLVAALIVVFISCYIISRWLIGPFYRYLLKSNNREILVLATVSLAFLFLSVTNYLCISMELGCFLAGTVISSQGHGLVEQIDSLIQPVKDVFSCLFFASVGLHVFPQFLAYEMTILTTLTLATVGTKFLISVLVLACLSPKGAWHVKWIVSAGLAQVSEFSFVLGSRARRLGLISREVYLLILGITTMSLLFAPALWQLTLWQLRIKSRQRSPPPSPVISKATHLDIVTEIPPTNSTDIEVTITGAKIKENGPSRQRLTTQ